MDRSTTVPRQNRAPIKLLSETFFVSIESQPTLAFFVHVCVRVRVLLFRSRCRELKYLLTKELGIVMRDEEMRRLVDSFDATKVYTTTGQFSNVARGPAPSPRVEKGRALAHVREKVGQVADGRLALCCMCRWPFRLAPRADNAGTLRMIGNGQRGGGVYSILGIMHGRSRMTVDARIPTMPGRSTSGFRGPCGYSMHQAQSAREVFW